jgi:hypothetical protein
MKTIFITREYDDSGKLVSETETTKVVKVAENQWQHFGFGMPPMEVNAEAQDG